MQYPTDPIQQIYDFNHQAGLLEKPYDDFLESSFQIEEALEPFIDGSTLFSAEFHDHYTAKELSRAIMSEVFSFTAETRPNASDLDRFDKALDAIVFAFGSLFKLGLTPEQALRGLSTVMDANMAKLNMPKDAHGKLTKPADFVGPEPTLKLILKERPCDK